MSGAVARPGHRGHHDPVLRARHPRRVSFDERADRAQVQRPPAAPPGTLVITRAAPSAQPAPPSLSASRPHRNDHHLLLIVEFDTLDDRLLESEQPSPYPGITHAVVPLSTVLTLDKPEPRQDNGVRCL
jgi:hypothetical protein